MEVFCRLRPILGDSCLMVESQTSIQVYCESHSLHRQTYKFKRVFDVRCNQSTIFQEVSFPLVEALIKGENGNILWFLCVVV